MIINVTNHGATGDGITDDAPAIQSALDAAVSGDVVFVPAGDHRLGNSLVMAISGVTLKGVGPASILRLMDGLIEKSAIILPEMYGGNLDPDLVTVDATISDLTIDGNHNDVVITTAPFFQSDYFGIWARQTEGLTIARCIVKNWPTDGISVGNSSRPALDLVIEDNRIDGVRRNGIHIGFADGAVIRRNLIIDTPSQWWGPAAGNGIDIEVEGSDFFGGSPFYPYVRNLVIEDNVLIRLGGATAGVGITLQPAYGPMRDVIFRRNYVAGHQRAFETTGALDIYGEVAGVRNITVEDNWFSQLVTIATSGYPMILGGASGVSIRRNVMNDASPGGNMSNGPAVDCIGSELVTIADNTIRLRETAGPNMIAKLTNACDSITVTDNEYQTMDDVQVTDDGTDTNTIVSGNVDISGTTWNISQPELPSFSVSEDQVISATTDVVVTVMSEIVRVYFFVDGVPCGQSDTAPYTFSINYTSGSHVLSAMSLDSMANLSDLASVTISVDAVNAVILQTAPDGGLYLWEAG